MLPGEVAGYRRGDEGCHGLAMDLLEHTQEVCALGDELLLGAGAFLVLHFLEHRLQ